MPTLRRWGDECVVHHALSNDTYRVSDAAGRILAALGAASSLDAHELAVACELDAEVVEEALIELNELDFVSPC